MWLFRHWNTEVVQNWFVVEGTAKHKGCLWSICTCTAFEDRILSMKTSKLLLLSDQQAVWARLLFLNHRFGACVVCTVLVLSQEWVKIWEEFPKEIYPVLQCFVPSWEVLWHFSPWFSHYLVATGCHMPWRLPVLTQECWKSVKVECTGQPNPHGYTILSPFIPLICFLPDIVVICRYFGGGVCVYRPIRASS